MDQYFCMSFAQLTDRESLRDIEACLRSRREKLYHLGIRGRISQSTLAEANERRDRRMYAGFCQILISKAKSLYADEDFDAEREKQLVFLTNNFVLPALTIAKLYKCQWQIELFFKWIKQHLRIKAFYGTSINAVKTQIWIAVSTYVLVAIIRKRLHLELNRYTILQILSITLFEKVPPDKLFTNYNYKNLPESKESLCNQINLFYN